MSLISKKRPPAARHLLAGIGVGIFQDTQDAECPNAVRDPVIGAQPDSEAGCQVCGCLFQDADTIAEMYLYCQMG